MVADANLVRLHRYRLVSIWAGKGCLAPSVSRPDDDPADLSICD